MLLKLKYLIIGCLGAQQQLIKYAKKYKIIIDDILTELYIKPNGLPLYCINKKDQDRYSTQGSYYIDHWASPTTDAYYLRAIYTDIIEFSFPFQRLIRWHVVTEFRVDDVKSFIEEIDLNHMINQQLSRYTIYSKIIPMEKENSIGIIYEHYYAPNIPFEYIDEVPLGYYIAGPNQLIKESDIFVQLYKKANTINHKTLAKKINKECSF